jgi:hypothetical protein
LLALNFPKKLNSKNRQVLQAFMHSTSGRIDIAPILNTGLMAISELSFLPWDEPHINEILNIS